MNTTKESKKELFFAVAIPQEQASNVDQAATEYGIDSAFSRIGCELGLLGFYAEFDDLETKTAFLDTIEGSYSPKMVWAS